MADVQYKFPDGIKDLLVCGDIEANGLLEDKKEWKAGELKVHKAADRVWMACYKIPEANGDCYDFIDDEMLKLHKRALIRHNRQHGRSNVKLFPMSALPQFCDHVGVQVMHFGMKYDFPVMEKLLGYFLPKEKRWDTFVQSSTQFCDRDLVEGSKSGAHSLESWARRLGNGVKVEHEDWLNFSIDMYRRCWRDVEIQCDLYDELQEERERDKLECNIDWTEPLRTEMDAAYWISWSEIWGFPIDEPYARSLVEKWDKHLADIEDKLLPTMPFRLSFDGCGAAINFETYSEGMLKNTNLTRMPIGWCWTEDSANRPTPVWNPFKKDGTPNENVNNYWLGKPATDYVPEEPEVFASPAVLDDNGKVIQKAVRARKARPAKEAKPRRPNCYEDDAGLTEPPLIKMTPDDVGGPYTRIQWNHYNLGSNNQVIEYLTRYTEWKCTERTEKGNPKLTEDSFDSIGEDGIGALIKDYLITKSRRTNILNFKDPSKGWISHIREDGRVSALNNSCGTPTARSRHSVIVNVPSSGARWGHEMRTCWMAADGCRMLGLDSSALEMRCLAHEIDCQKTRDLILEGDFHQACFEQIPEFSASRGSTKGFTYALLYGASDAKLGSLVNVDGCLEMFASKVKLKQRGWIQDTSGNWRHKNWNPKKDSLTYKEAQETVCGSIVRMRYMEGLEPLGKAIEKFTKLSEKGYLKALDGRKLNCRSSHSALNLRLQSSGAILCKKSVILTMERLEEAGYVVVGNKHDPSEHVELYAFVHDEIQMGIPEKYFTDKVLKVDVSGFDMNNPDERAEAKGLCKMTADRFINREYRRKGHVWSKPVIDVEKGEILTSHSIVTDIAKEAFYEAGRVYNFSSKTESEAIVGNNWAQTH